MNANAVAAVKTAEKSTSKPRIGRFVLERELGRGMQGRVYQAIDPQLKRRVALKLLMPADLPSQRPGTLTSDDVLGEGQAVASLKHAAIVPVYEAGVHASFPFLVFELVEGTTLKSQLSKNGPMPLEQTLVVLRQLAEGIDYAHRQGVVHLDLTPANIMLEDNVTPRIMDFGLSALAGRARADAEVVVGTPRYMSPEHFARAPLGAGSDIFALGLIAFEMLTGQTAVTGSSPEEIMHQLMCANFDFSALQERDVPGPLELAIRAALRPAPDMRMRNAGDFAAVADELLQESAQGGESNSELEGIVQFLLRRMQRNGDFPALSNNLVELNRVLDSDSASAEKIASIVLRDYAMSNKLLRLANSAFYGGAGGQVTKVSQAVVKLGLAQVRLACCSLSYLGHVGPDKHSPALDDSVVRSFLCGLIARHLASRRWRELAEEAFLCGMFRYLGQQLTVFYFPEDYAYIETLITERGYSEEDAFAEALGVRAPVLAQAIARSWQFPQTVIQAMAPVTAMQDEVSLDGEKLLLCGALAEALVQHCTHEATAESLASFQELPTRFSAYGKFGASDLLDIVRAGLEKCEEIGPLLDLPFTRASYLEDLRTWCDPQMTEKIDMQTARSSH